MPASRLNNNIFIRPYEQYKLKRYAQNNVDNPLLSFSANTDTLQRSAQDYQETETYNISSLREELEQQKEDQGIISKAWDGIKNFFGTKNSSSNIEETIKKFENGEISEEEARQALDEYKNVQNTFLDKLSGIISTAGLIGTVAGAVLSFIPGGQVIGLPLLAISGKVALGGIFVDNALDLVDNSTDKDGLTKDELKDLAIETGVEAVSYMAGRGIGKLTGNIHTNVIGKLTSNGGNKIASNIAGYGLEALADGTLSLTADYGIAQAQSLITTGETIAWDDYWSIDRFTSEGRSQLIGILTGVATSKQYPTSTIAPATTGAKAASDKVIANTTQTEPTNAQPRRMVFNPETGELTPAKPRIEAKLEPLDHPVAGDNVKIKLGVDTPAQTKNTSIDDRSVVETDLPNNTRSVDDVKFKGTQGLKFNEQVIKEIDLSTLNADGIGSYLDYTTRDFMKNLVTYLKSTPEEKRKELLLKIGIQLPTSQKKIITYNGVLDASKLGISKERLAEISKLDIKDILFIRRKEFSPEEAIAYLINKYTTQNSFHTGNTELDSALNKILEEIPEFINIVSRPQHSHQKYSVDIHTLKVLQNILNDFHYKTLTPKQKEILKYATLLHDFGKNAHEVTPGHSIDSEKYARTILSQKDLDKDTTEQILTLIKNHHWFEEYNNGLLDREGVKALFGNNKELFNLAVILSKSDIMAVTNLSDMQTKNWYYELISFVENKPLYQIEPPILIQRSNYSLSEIPNEIKRNGYISTFSELGLDPTKAHQRCELLTGWIEKIKAGKIQELSDNQILDIWATKKYRELDDFPDVQQEYITRFNNICKNQTITFRENEIFIRTTPVDSNTCNSFFTISKDPTWPAAAARIKLSQDSSLPKSVEERLIKDKLEYLSRNPQIEKSGKIPPSTIYIIEPNIDNARAISGFDWEQTGSLTGEDKNFFGSGKFRQEVNENGYSTEVNFSAEERFKLHPHKPPTISKVKTISGLEFDINIVYIIPD